jgi:opacity protein-like surface antigen
MSLGRHDAGYVLMVRGFAIVAIATGVALTASMARANTDEEASKSGFFVGLQSGLISDSGLAPQVAGYQGALNTEGRYSVTASGYYLLQTDWSINTYVGGGLGAFNLSSDPALATSSLDFGYQGIAGVTYQFSPRMTLGLEYRYLGSVDPWSRDSFDASTIHDESQSVSLRFDYSF